MSVLGFGKVWLLPKTAPVGIAEKTLFYFEGTTVNVDSSPSEIVARARNAAGTLVTKRTGLSEETYTVTFETEFMNWYHMQLLHDQYAKTASSLSIPLWTAATVPSSSPYEVNDVAVTSGNAANIFVQVTERGTWGEANYRDKVATTPAAGQVFVDGATNKLKFHSSDAGAPFVWTKPTSYSSVQAIGYDTASYDHVGSCEAYFMAFNSEDYPSGLLYHFPTLTRKRIVPSTNFGDTPVTMSLEFGATPKTGQTMPYEMFNLATAA